jgi:integrase
MEHTKDLLSKIINTGYNIKINYRVVEGKYVLFLNHRAKTNGRVRQQSKRLVVLTGNKKEDIILINQAIEERAFREKQLRDNVVSLGSPKSKMLLTNYINQIIAKAAKKSTAENYSSMKNKIILFAGDQVRLEHIDKAFCMGFLNFLTKTVPKSACQPFKMFKAVLNRAIYEELIFDLPFLRTMSIKYTQPKREFLTEKEIKLVFDAPSDDIDCKNAFLFSCFTGLRYSDLRNLKFSNIYEGSLSIVQHKTSEPIRIPLHDIAKDIIKQQIKDRTFNDYVFNINKDRWRKYQKDMLEKTGITKKITGHCARHSFATLLITSGVDIYTTSKLLGHSDVKTTQIYAQIVDAKKDEAINKLPNLS